MKCARCYRDAATRAIGRFANGRPAVEHLCERDQPPAEQIGTIRYLGNTERTYRLDAIEPLSVAVPT